MPSTSSSRSFTISMVSSSSMVRKIVVSWPLHTLNVNFIANVKNERMFKMFKMSANVKNERIELKIINEWTENEWIKWTDCNQAEIGYSAPNDCKQTTAGKLATWLTDCIKIVLHADTMQLVIIIPSHFTVAFYSRCLHSFDEPGTRATAVISGSFLPPITAYFAFVLFRLFPAHFG